MKSSSRQEKSSSSHNKSIAVAILPKRDPNNSWALEKHPDTKNSFFWFTWNYSALKKKKKREKKPQTELNLNFTLSFQHHSGIWRLFSSISS